MSKLDVMNSLRFWGESFWSTQSSSQPLTLTEEQTAKITASISNLYDNSPTARAILEQLAAQGDIRIGGTSNNGYFVPSKETSPGSGVYTDPYIMLAPDDEFVGMTSYGTSFIMPFDVIVGHELSHWSNGTHDLVGPINNNTLNGADYDYVGDTVRSEWTIAGELGYTDLRATYLALLSPLDSRYSLIDQSHVYVSGGYAEIVRFGDIENTTDPYTGQPQLSPEDYIDYSARTDGRTTLTLAFRGNDYVIGSSASDWIYGGSGDDTIFGGAGKNYLYGEDGNDYITSQGSGDEMWGGSGDDVIENGGGGGLMMGGDGSDTIRILSTSVGSSRILSGAGDDIIDASARPSGSSWAGADVRVFKGDGNDILLAKAVDGYGEDDIDAPDHWGVDVIEFRDIDSSDITVIWDPTVFATVPGAYPSDPNWYFARGNLTFKVNSTGDSILLESVYGSWIGRTEEDFTSGETFSLAIMGITFQNYGGPINLAPGISFQDAASNQSKLASISLGGKKFIPGVGTRDDTFAINQSRSDLTLGSLNNELMPWPDVNPVFGASQNSDCIINSHRDAKGVPVSEYRARTISAAHELVSAIGSSKLDLSLYELGHHGQALFNSDVLVHSPFAQSRVRAHWS